MKIKVYTKKRIDEKYLLAMAEILLSKKFNQSLYLSGGRYLLNLCRRTGKGLKSRICKSAFKGRGRDYYYLEKGNET